MMSENSEMSPVPFVFSSPNYASSLTLQVGSPAVGDDGTGGGAATPSQSSVSDNSWVHLTRSSTSYRPPPPAPIPIPSPVMNARGLADQVIDPIPQSESNVPDAVDADADVDAQDRDLESGVRQRGGSARRRKERGKSIMDGFINGLKKLPNAVMKNYYSAERKAGTGRGNVSTIDTPNAQQSQSPVADSGLHVDGPTPFALRGRSVDLPRHANGGPVTHDNEPLTPPQHVLLSPAFGVNSPVLVEPRPSSDYAKMESPLPSPPEPSLGHYVSRIHQFLKDVNDLPWVSARTTVDYIPGQSSRSRSRTQGGAHAQGGRPATTLSWYAPPLHQSIDLLSSGPSAIARLPNSSVTLAYHPDFPQDVNEPRPSGVSGGGGGGPSRTFSLPPRHQGDKFPEPQPLHIASQGSRHVSSRSLQIYGPPLSGQTVGHPYSYPILRPPPARTS